ncbi:hypothetical protein DBV05_g5004 [Lasiodiplodia theobromae]|uniref:Uncharacterized protein n=1 Tax=Lasiodiplodia theobromae TaxID=45133 RepID=A0A5N5DEY0_9PEZI|nr:hypothetical protein DBV05_g5004 [Lasiodiplodia theobromae]
MSHQPNDGVQSSPFTRETSPDDAVFEETSIAEAPATALQSMKPPSSHSPEAKSGRNSVERPHAPGMAPHFLPVTPKSSPASSSEISFKTTRRGEPSEASGKTTSQQKKRKYHLVSREDDDDIKPYSFGKEPPRKKEIDHPSFKKAERAARNIPAEIISIIDQSSVTHGDIDFVKDIKNKAAAAMSPKATTGVKLGLRGDSGVGEFNASLFSTLR